MDLESELSRLLRQSSQELAAPPVVLMVAEAAARGRALRRRRRLAVAGSAVAAAALVGTVGATGLLRPARTHAVAGAPTASALTSTPTADLAAAPADTGPVPTAATTADGMLAILSGLLPAGRYSHFDPAGPPGGAGGGFRVDYADEAGPTSIAVVLGAAAGPPLDCAAGRLPPAVEGEGGWGGPGGSCEASTLPDGDRVLSYRTEERAGSLRGVSVASRRADGVQVVISSYNGTVRAVDGRLTGAPTRSAPALDPARLSALARDPQWRLTVEQELIDEGATWRRAWQR
ncbi:hypothetical protein AB0K43_17035 [Kitasatospora sp. NPDC049258]|uniref:hypothetical protein n=1 Tax=Kitasatospora sp. NPDC049258 TaxID=3155394 RepID=UPI00341858BE